MVFPLNYQKVDKHGEELEKPLGPCHLDCFLKVLLSVTGQLFFWFGYHVNVQSLHGYLELNHQIFFNVHFIWNLS